MPPSEPCPLSFMPPKVVYVIQVFLFTSFTVATAAVLAQITPSRLSGKLQSITGLATLGLALGPTVVALVSDRFFTGGQALHNGLIVTVGVTAAAGALFYAVVASKIRKGKGLLQ